MSSADQIPDHVAYEELSADEAAALDLARRRLYTLNATAKRIYEHARQGLASRAIAEALAQEFDVSPEQCEPDVERLLGELTEAGLLCAPGLRQVE